MGYYSQGYDPQIGGWEVGIGLPYTLMPKFLCIAPTIFQYQG
jgi:hypothetical protein